MLRDFFRGYGRLVVRTPDGVKHTKDVRDGYGFVVYTKTGAVGAEFCRRFWWSRPEVTIEIDD